MTRVRSIRRFLLAGILALVSVSLAVSGFIGYLEANHEMEELFDARLAQSARITNQLLSRYLKQRGELPSNGAVYQEWEQAVPDDPHQEKRSFSQLGRDNEFTPYGHEFERNLYFQLLDERGAILLRSPSAPAQPLTTLERGFNSETKDHHEWRTFTLYNEDQRTWLIVAERDDERGELASSMATLTMLPLFITLPFLLGLLWWLVSAGLSPLRQVAQAISERHPANLSPLTLSLKAEELTPIVNEINRLMHTLADTIEREKQFTNEAAHELRTPLAVLRIHSENLMAAEDDATREQALRKMLLALDRSDRLIRQLLTQARIDNQQTPALNRLDLSQLLQGTLATLAPLALKKEQQLSLEGEEHLQVMGQAVLMDLMFGNLIDNALRYTPAGGEIAVMIAAEGNRVRVDIRDSGPGIPTAALSRLCERFYRVNPQQGDGVGLGMAIVRRIAELHGADLDVHNRPHGGLEVSIWLPIPHHIDAPSAHS
ncbi:ATP-binding protein [Aeromonas sp. MR16]|uniref:ATP-binding protein n=1 Tax=Aeromonas sp. MR16 TaxID=2923420 RepID=UPI001F4BB620|nr:ATP-binding protein [Aeromonas sp. MR16]MCH7372788.1 ATP-binding protein [Aeromonas sp. MR16]